jgi:hypothetical protein
MGRFYPSVRLLLFFYYNRVSYIKYTLITNCTYIHTFFLLSYHNKNTFVVISCPKERVTRIQCHMLPFPAASDLITSPLILESVSPLPPSHTSLLHMKTGQTAFQRPASDNILLAQEWPAYKQTQNCTQYVQCLWWLKQLSMHVISVY